MRTSTRTEISKPPTGKESSTISSTRTLVAEPLRMLAQEIDDTRAARSEPDLSQFLLRKVGVCYDPRPEATFNEWLGQIAAWLRKHANEIDGRTASSDE